MNRKLFNGLLLLTVATGGIGTFTSCKDTEQDFRNVVLIGQEDLSAQIAAIRNLTDEVFRDNLDRYLDAKDYASAADLIALTNRVNGLADKIDDLEEAYKAADEALKQDLLNTINVLLGDLKTTLMSYTDTKISELGDELRPLITNAQNTANSALAQANANKDAIEGIKTDLENVKTRVGKLESDLATLETKVGNLETKYNDLETKYGELSDLFNEYMTNNDARVDQLRADLDNLNAEVNDMYNRIMQKLAKYVTGIEVNQVHNAIYGSFNFPVGVQSNIIANYYGKSDHDVVFPPNPDLNGGLSIEYSTHYATENLTRELEAIGAPFQTVMSAGVVQLDKLADVYMTVNPTNRDFSDLRLTLVNSRNEEVPVLDELQLQKSDKLLSMGVSRASATESGNGFYVAEAKPRTSFTESELNGIRYEIEDGLKSAFKDAIKDHTKKDFLELATLIMKQFSNDMPAYAVKCEWDDTELNADGEEVAVKNAVLSDYKLAVTTFRPLSFSTGFGIGTDHELPTPTMGYIRDRINDAFASIKNRLQLGLTGIKVDDITITLDLDIKVDPTQITIDLGNSPVFSQPGVTYDEERDCYVDENGNRVTPDGYLAEDTFIVLGYDPNTGEITDPNQTALNPFVDSIVESIMKAIDGNPEEGKDGLAKQIADQVNEQLKSIVKQVNDQLADVQAKIDNTIDDIKNKIDAELNGKFGRLAQELLDLYNGLANKVNNFLKDPNAYLQVMMAYMGNDNMLHRLSTTASDATPLSVRNNLELFATSYNAEIIVPAYKKYVAVVSAVDANGNALNISDVKAANTDALNTVVNGDRQRFYIDGSKLKEGYTYKIVYSSLDYRGYTSTQAYYVRATK